MASVAAAWLPMTFVVLATALIGCRGANVLVPQFPQIQEVGELGDYGVERLRDGDACRKSSPSMDTYIACMESKGWAFIGRGTVYPGPGCWEVREANDPRQLPQATCFHRAIAPQRAPAPSPAPVP